jgi:hypothetical protein
MFNIFETEGERVQERAKVRMLLKKVEHPQLQAAVGTLRVRAQMDKVTFTDCAIIFPHSSLSCLIIN